MGVKTKSSTDGNWPTELYCRRCDRNYWIDEEMANDCPYCNNQDFSVV